MGIRRRRRKLTTTLSSMQSRLKSVELRPISLLTTDQINAAVTIGAADTPDRFFIGDNAPNTYNIIHDAYYYPKKLTGKDNDLVEIYTQGSLNLSVDKRIEISGIHGTADTVIDVTSDNFTVAEVEESPWTGRASYKHDPTQDQLPTVVIGYAYSVVPETLAPSSLSTRQRLETRATVNTFSITNTTVTINTTATHRFKVDDVIYVNLNDDGTYHPESNTAYGTDGIFKVTGVTSNTLSYTLPAGVGTPTGDINPSVDVYVFATARNWCGVGDTWVDTSGAEETTYYWAGLRWAEFTATSTGPGGSDTTPPAAVANVAVVVAESGGYTDGSGTPRARITLEWDAPTQDSNGDPLTDLVGYEVWYSDVNGSNWIKSGVIIGEEKYTASNLDPAKTIYFKVYAVDSSLNRSTAVDFSAVSGTFAAVLNPPSAPILASDLGVVTARWNGLDNTGLNPHPSIRLIETHVSLTNGFTPSTTTRVASMTASTDNYSSIYQYNDGTGTLINMAYGTDYYFRFVAVDAAGNRTTGSTQAIGRISQVDGAAIEAGAISAKILAGETIVATSNASAFQIEMNANHLRAVNKTSGVETFKMNTANGAVTIGAGITNTSINGGAITVTNLSANSITTGTLNASVVSVTNLNASNITTGSLNANLITSGTLNAANVSVTNLNANNITTGTLTADRVFGGTLSGATYKFLGSGGGTIGYIWSDGSALRYSYQTGSLPDPSAANMLVLTNTEGILKAGSGNSGSVTVQAASAILAATGSDSTVGMTLDNAATPQLRVSKIGGGTPIIYTTEDLSIDETKQLRVTNIRRTSSNGQIAFRTTAGNIAAYIDTSNTSGLTFDTIWITGRVSAGGAYAVRSSRRFKTNIQNYTEDVSSILDLNLVSYQVDPRSYYKVPPSNDSPEELSEVQIGLIAEEVADLGLNGLVLYDSEDPTLPYAIDYSKIGLFLIPVVRELRDEVSRLKNELNDIKTRLSNLENNQTGS